MPTTLKQRQTRFNFDIAIIIKKKKKKKKLLYDTTNEREL